MKRILLLSTSLFSLLASNDAISQCLTTTNPTNDCSYGDAIDNITIGATTATNAGCTSGSGYSNFATPIWTFDEGVSYPLSATVGGAMYDQGLAVWIDLNNNGEYEATEQVYASTTPDLTHSGTVAIPTGVVTGVQLPMRVMCAYNSSIPAADACVSGQGGYGETEDYLAVINPVITSNVQATSVDEPLDNDCGATADEIWVTVTNATANAETDIDVVVNLTGMITDSYTIVIPTLAGSASTSVLVATIDTEVGGVLNMEFVVDHSDEDSSDDTLMVTRTILDATDLAISGPTEICLGDSTILDAVAGVTETITWMAGGSSVGTGTAFQTSAITADTQFVATSDNGCRANDTINIVVLPLPTASFTSTSSLFTADFSGTASDYDSIYWDFDDGSLGFGLTPQHTYLSEGTFNVCFYALNDCDTVEYCEDVVIMNNVSVDELNADQVSVYPNPTSDEVSITFEEINAAGAKWKLVNADGRIMQQGAIDASKETKKLTVSLAKYPRGVYFFHMSNEQGDLVKVNLLRN